MMRFQDATVLQISKLYYHVNPIGDNKKFQEKSAALLGALQGNFPIHIDPQCTALAYSLLVADSGHAPPARFRECHLGRSNSVRSGRTSDMFIRGQFLGRNRVIALDLDKCSRQRLSTLRPGFFEFGPEGDPGNESIGTGESRMLSKWNEGRFSMRAATAMRLRPYPES